MVKVLDFGISKALDRDLDLTSSHAMLGTPAYMSPEQLRTSRDVDVRTDVWSLGVVMFELLAGAQPFQATSFGNLVVQVVTERARPLAGDFPRGLASVVARCLERDPNARFQSVGEPPRPSRRSRRIARPVRVRPSARATSSGARAR